MKAKKIFKGAVAGLMSASLLLSGIPVNATGVDSTVSGQQTEAEGEAVDTAGTETAPEQKTAPEQQTGTSGDAAGEETLPEQQEPSDQNVSDGETKKDTPEETEQQQKEDTDSGQDKNGESEADDKNKESEADDKKTGSEADDKNKESEADGKDKDGKSETDEPIPADEQKPQAFSLNSLPTVNGSIAIDGSLADWAEVTARTSSASNVDSWKVAFSPDESTLYFSYTGTASTEWDYGFGNNKFNFTYSDGVTGADSGLSVSAWNGGAIVKNGNWGDVAGAQVAVTNEAHRNNPGPYTVEFSVPVSFFHSMDFTVTFGDTSVSAGDIEKINGNAADETEPPAVYNGITIDGNYSDWKAVAKTDASCPNSAHPGCLSQVAAVYDGDWFYIYIRDGEGSNASGAGTHSNGKFAITSDLGYETDIQLTTAPAVNGVDGAQVSYVGSEWEIAIPKSQLPKYEEKLSFGFYLGDTLVGDIVNLQPDSGNNLENLFNGIIYDGEYEDWEDYGHTTIEYATPGSQESQIDAKGALYSSGDKLYGHVVTGMPEHLQEAGGEFTAAVTIAFNQAQESLRSGSYNWQMAFYPRCVTVDPNGNINWNPQLNGLSEGTYEFYLASLDAWGTSTNINNLNDMDQLYGKMIMTIGKDGKDEMEFYLDLPMVAKKLGVDETDLKQIAGQFGRIGQQWLYTAGTSTGPIVGVVLCVASVGLVFWYRKRKMHELPCAAA